MQGSSGESSGRIVAIWRYPIKSMKGEEIEATRVTERGLLGDRAYALIDAETGNVVSAKNPRRWPNLFEFRSSFAEPLNDAGPLPPAVIALPDGATVSTDAPDVELRVSNAAGRPVHLARSPIDGASAEGYWPDYDWLTDRDTTFEFPLPPGTFFDGATVHLVTTATLNSLRAKAPESRFDVPRFRPNFLIETTEEGGTYVENGWVGQTLAVGEVLLQVVGPTPRCVMTTLAQGDLPNDPAVLRTAVQENEANVGVYATVLHGGQVRRGDPVALR